MSLSGDYRVEPKGLSCLALAGVLTGATMVLRPRHQVFLAPVEGIQVSLCSILLCCVLVLLKERPVLADFYSIDLVQVCYIFINAVCSAVALSIGGSTLALGSLSRTVRFTTVPIGFISLTGCLARLSTQSSLMTIVQLCSFCAALFALVRLKTKLPGEVDEPAQERKVEPVHTLGRIISSDNGNIKHSPDRVRRLSTALDPYLSRFQWSGAGLYITAIIAFLFLNFKPNRHNIPTPLLDSTFQPNSHVEVVISMYKEPTASVTSLISSLQHIPAIANATIHVYTKNEKANRTNLQLLTGAHKVTVLSNTGRESGTYLYHILHHWDALARHTLFVQAEVHNRAELLWRLEKYFDPLRTGMLDLGFRGHVYPCTGTDQWGWNDDSGVVSRVYNKVYRTPCHPFILSYKGQFLVSASRIRGIHKSVYKDLYQALQEQDSWAHSKPYIRGRADSISAPVFGYTLERLWGVIFQCSDIAAAWKCPSFLGRLWVMGVKTDCQCLDS